MTEHLLCILQPIIDRIPTWRGAREFNVEQIGGLTNTNYAVTVDGEQFVLRVSGQNTTRLGIDRTYEYAALQAATEAGICPQVVAFLQPEGHLVTRRIAGRHWNVREFRTPENVRLLTETVKRIHALPANGATFSPFRRVTDYLGTAQELNVPLPSNLPSCLATMRVVEADQQRDKSAWQKFCHNDLVSVNYLFTEPERRILVLDWEFSGRGDLYYDLATLVYTHDSEGPIPTNLEEVMLECYFGIISDFQRRRLLEMKFMLMLFTGMWGLAQAGMVRAGMIPAVEGFDYLEFARYLFDHEICELQELIS